jgi:hypothetical protein
MAEILVRAVDGTCVDPFANPLRGMPVVVMEDGHVWGKCECLPEYVVIKVPGVAADVVREYTKTCPWPTVRPVPPKKRKMNLTGVLSSIKAFSRPFATVKETEEIELPWRRRRYRIHESLVIEAEQGEKSTVTLEKLVGGLLDQTTR